MLCARCWVTNLSLSILIWCYYRKYSRHHFEIIILIMKRKENLPACGTPETHTLRKQAIVEYFYVWFLSVKEVSGTFPFTCPITALPVSYCGCLNFCTALSTWSPRFISCDLDPRCWSLANWAKCFYFGPLKINGTNSKSVCFDCIILKKTEKNYETRNTTVSFSVLCCFRSVAICSIW